MKNIKYSLEPFFKAWEMLLDVELPASMKVSDNAVDNDVMVLNFPVVGAFVGVVLYVAAWILKIVPGQPMGPFLAGIVITLFLEMITSGRSMSSLISCIENKLGGYSLPESLATLNDDFNVNRSSTGTLLLVSLFLIRILCFSFLVQHGSLFWLIIVLTLNYGTQGYLAASNEMRSGQPFFELGETFDRNIWLVTAALMVVCGLVYFPVLAVTLAIVIFFAWKFRSYCDVAMGGMTAKLIGLGGYLAELIALLVGLTFLVR